MTTAIQQTKPNYLKKAFKSSGNYLVLFFSAMLCIVGIFNPLALIAIPVLEAIFLASKVSSQKFRASVDAEFQKGKKEAREGSRKMSSVGRLKGKDALGEYTCAKFTKRL